MKKKQNSNSEKDVPAAVPGRADFHSMGLPYHEWSHSADAMKAFGGRRHKNKCKTHVRGCGNVTLHTSLNILSMSQCVQVFV